MSTLFTAYFYENQRFDSAAITETYERFPVAGREDFEAEVFRLGKVNDRISCVTYSVLGQDRVSAFNMQQHFLYSMGFTSMMYEHIAEKYNADFRFYLLMYNDLSGPVKTGMRCSMWEMETRTLYQTQGNYWLQTGRKRELKAERSADVYLNPAPYESSAGILKDEEGYFRRQAELEAPYDGRKLVLEGLGMSFAEACDGVYDAWQGDDRIIAGKGY